jgi:PKD repeat protein
VTFNGSASTPSPGASSIVSWVWSFSDGGSTTGLTTTHVYGSAGSYDVTLTVTDDKGQSGTLKKTVVVN